MKELKPCPFCGGVAKKIAEQINGKNMITVVCINCHAGGPVYITANHRVKDENNPAIKGWNTRYIPQHFEGETEK